MKVLNIGSLSIDKTYSVKAFVQPKETIKALKYEEFCGGKGLNQSVALARAGAEAYHAGAIGTDGGMLKATLEGAGVHVDYLQTLNAASGQAIIQVDETGQNSIIICAGTNDCVETSYIDSLLSKMQTGDIVLLQNETSNVAYAIAEAKKAGLYVAFNPSPLNEAVADYPLEAVDLFLLNEVEGRQLAEIESEEPEDIMAALHARFPKAAFVLTLGENGSYYFDENEKLFQPIFSVETVDTTGAGDTFCGYFIAGLIEGLSHENCLRNAAAASAIAVSRKGASPGIPKREEVEAFLREKNNTENGCRFPSA